MQFRSLQPPQIILRLLILVEICREMTILQQVEVVLIFMPYFRSIDRYAYCVCLLHKYEAHIILEDQHMEWKPAGQPEHASLKQCQLIVANRCSGHPQQVVDIRFLCNVIDAGALIGPCSHVTSCCCLIC